MIHDECDHYANLQSVTLYRITDNHIHCSKHTMCCKHIIMTDCMIEIRMFGKLTFESNGLAKRYTLYSINRINTLSL